MSDDFSPVVAQHNITRNQEWFAAFQATPAYAALNEAEQTYALAITRAFTELSYRYFVRPPRRWTVSSLEQVLGLYFPSMITARLAFFEAVFNVLDGYLAFLGAQHKISNQQALRTHLREACRAGVTFATDQDYWSPNKKLGMQVLEGVTQMSDRQALASFVENYNFGVPLLGLDQRLPDRKSNVIVLTPELRAAYQDRHH